MISRLSIGLILIPVLIGTAQSADIERWDSPRKVYRLKVKRGPDSNASKKIRAANAVATLYRLADDERYLPLNQFVLENPVCPEEVLISDDGKYIVTLNDVFSGGIGANVVAIYNESGKLLGRYSLSDLATPEQLEQFPKLHAMVPDAQRVMFCSQSILWHKYAGFTGNSFEVELNLPNLKNGSTPAVVFDLTKSHPKPERNGGAQRGAVRVF